MNKTLDEVKEHYVYVNSLLVDFAKENFNGIQPPSSAIVELFKRILINMQSLEKLIEPEFEHTLSLYFLSSGLVLRGIISDVINFWYLQNIFTVLGEDALMNEIKVLDAEFASSWKQMLNNETAISGLEGTKEETRQKAVFAKSFSDLIKDPNTLAILSKEDIRGVTNKKFYVDNNLNKKTFISETVKIECSTYRYKNEIKNAFKYLSQFQHFSPRANDLLQIQEFQSRHLYFYAFTLHIVIETAIDVLSTFKHGEHLRVLKEENIKMVALINSILNPPC